jgi:hypothetical protein
MAKVQQPDDAKRKHAEQRVAECERAAAKAVSQGRFMDTIEAVENNICLRARGGIDSPSDLLCMLQVCICMLAGCYMRQRSCAARTVISAGARGAPGASL